MFFFAPTLMGGGIKRCFCRHLTSICLTSVSYIGPNSRTERSRKTKIGTEVALVTRDSDTTFKIKESRDVGYLCANFGLPRPLCSWLRPEVRDRHQTKASSLADRGIITSIMTHCLVIMMCVVCLVIVGSATAAPTGWPWALSHR